MSNKINSKTMYLPKEVYDSDGPGDENWKDDVAFEDRVADSFEYYDEMNYDSSRNSTEGGRRSAEFLRKKVGLNLGKFSLMAAMS